MSLSFEMFKNKIESLSKRNIKTYKCKHSQTNSAETVDQLISQLAKQS